MTSSATLADAASRAVFHQLPPAAVRAAKWSLLDALGVMSAATALEPACVPFVAMARECGGQGPCTVIGHDGGIPAPFAAFANGSLAHALDFEDAHDGAPAHPNAAVIPAALAIAQQRPGVSGERLLTAIAVGADLVCRLALALDANPELGGWYPPPILSVPGAAAAAGHLLGLDSRGMINAWSLSLCQATFSSEFKRTAHSTLRAVRDGFAAQAGVQSALLAARGAVGFERPFEGEAGFFALYARGHFSEARLLRDLGTAFHGAQVSYKPWPSCRGTHAFVQAALEWHAAGVPAGDIAAIGMGGGPTQLMLAQPLDLKRAPRTAIDAKFSAPFCIASAFVNGRLALASFLPEALADAAVLALAQRATFQVDAAVAPGDIVSGTTRIRLRDGSVRERRVTQPLGSPAQPLTEAQLIAKFRDCAAHARRPLRPEAESRLIDIVLNLEVLDDLDATLFAALRDLEPGR